MGRLDGTFNSSFSKGNIIIYSTISPNNTYIPIVFGWCIEESSQYIIPSMELIKEQIEEEIPHFIIDQGNALKTSIREVFYESKIRFCSHHLSDKQYYHNIERILALETKEEFDAQVNEITSSITSKNKAEEVKENFRLASKFYNPMLTLDHTTNNACESINANLKRSSDQSVLNLTKELYDFSYNQMAHLSNHSNENKSEFCDFVFNRFAQYQTRLGSVKITQKNGRAKVKILDKVFEVVHHADDTYHCQCNESLELGFPCIHIYAVIANQKDAQELLKKNTKAMFLKEEIDTFCLSLSPPSLFENEYESSIVDCISPPFRYISRREKRK